MMKPKVKYYILSIIGTFLAITIFVCTVGLYNLMQSVTEINCGLYALYDRFDVFDDNDEFTENIYDFFKMGDSLEKMIDMYDELNKEFGESYYVFNGQRIYPDSKIVYNKYCEHWSLAVNSAALKAFTQNGNMKLIKGELFSEDDYFYHEGDLVPVIVGSTVNNCVDIGDTFECDYLSNNITCVVKGVMDIGADCPQIQCENPDKCILIPALVPADYDPIEKISDEDFRWYQKIMIGNLSGFIQPEQDVILTQCRIDKICEKVNIKPFILCGVFSINIFNMGFGNSHILIFAGLTLLYLALVVGIYFIQHQHTKNIVYANKSASKKRNVSKIYFDYFICVLVSVLAFLVINFVYLRPLHINLWIIVITALVLWLIIPLLSILKAVIHKI